MALLRGMAPVPQGVGVNMTLPRIFFQNFSCAPIYPSPPPHAHTVNSWSVAAAALKEVFEGVL